MSYGCDDEIFSMRTSLGALARNPYYGRYIHPLLVT